MKVTFNLAEEVKIERLKHYLVNELNLHPMDVVFTMKPSKLHHFVFRFTKRQAAFEVMDDYKLHLEKDKDNIIIHNGCFQWQLFWIQHAAIGHIDCLEVTLTGTEKWYEVVKVIQNGDGKQYGVASAIASIIANQPMTKRIVVQGLGRFRKEVESSQRYIQDNHTTKSYLEMGRGYGQVIWALFVLPWRDPSFYVPVPTNRGSYGDDCQWCKLVVNALTGQYEWEWRE